MATDSWGWSWGGPFTRFRMWGAFTQPAPPATGTYGPPFQDFSLDLTSTIDRFLKMKRDVHARMGSTRLDFNVESEP